MRYYLSENTSLTTTDMAVAWKTLEENASADSKKNNIDEDNETLTAEGNIETEKED